MNRLQIARTLEADFKGMLNQYYYGIEYNNFATERLSRDLQVESRGRHNYLRQQALDRANLVITYRNMTIAKAYCYPSAKVAIFPRAPNEAPKGYFATKVLERILYYHFPNVRVE